VKVPKKVNLNDKTLLLLDGHAGIFTPEQLVRLAGMLKLDTSPPSSTAMAQERPTGRRPRARLPDRKDLDA
jgi:hypothetical protein